MEERRITGIGLIPPLDFCFVIFQYLADLHFDLIL